MNRVLNWERNPPDRRDFTLSLSIPKTLPGYSYLTKFMGPVKDQLDIGSCVGHGISEAYEAVAVHHKKVYRRFSELFPYYIGRTYINCEGEDSGCYIRDAFKGAQKYGIPPYELWPYVKSKVLVKPTIKAYTEAEKFQALRYEKITSLLELKACIAEYRHPVVFGFDVYESFWNIGANGIMPVPNPRFEELQGGHCVLAMGYNDKARLIRVRNSWGPNWGCFGDFFMPYEVFESEMCDDRTILHRGEQI